MFAANKELRGVSVNLIYEVKLSLLETHIKEKDIMIVKESTIQDKVLNRLIETEEEITVILLNGFQMNCKVVAFDNFSVLFLQVQNGKRSLIYKHAISTLTFSQHSALHDMF